MRVSQYFKLSYKQPSLEFVDVDVYGDTKVFVDPRALRDIDSGWAKECISQLQSFFDAVMRAIQAGNHSHARQLLAALHEPNETHFGLSRGRAQGRAMADGLAGDVWTALSQSRAAETGLLEDLEDTILFVEGVGFDIVSDVTINIIRAQLAKFTQDASTYYGISLESDVALDRFWDRRAEEWQSRYVDLPVTEFGPLLLVPKSIVRRHKTTFSPDEYFNHWILPWLQAEELRAGSALVEVLKKGGRRVTKKAVKGKYGIGRDAGADTRAKDLNPDTTLRNPSILDNYRAAKSRATPSLSHDEIAEVTQTPPPDWDGLLAQVLDVKPGAENATRYHRAVEALLKALFYPALDFSSREFPIHAGRKRIDITFANIARSGFFDWVNRVAQAPAPQVFAECKNYGRDIGNPELDQLAGRFSSIRGRLGFLCYRGFGDKQLVIQRCRDTALDGRGFIVALDDDDLARLVSERKTDTQSVAFAYLLDRYRELL